LTIIDTDILTDAERRISRASEVLADLDSKTVSVVTELVNFIGAFNRSAVT